MVPMEQASLPRLQYFAVVAREGSLVRAARELGTTHSNLSMHMRALEEELGGDLFERRGRRLVLTALGNEIAWYADEVSRLVRDASEVARSHERPRRTPLRVGVVGSIRKALAFRLLEPAFTVAGYGPVVARQDTQDRPRRDDPMDTSTSNLRRKTRPPGRRRASRLEDDECLELRQRGSASQSWEPLT